MCVDEARLRSLVIELHQQARGYCVNLRPGKVNSICARVLVATALCGPRNESLASRLYRTWTRSSHRGTAG